MDKRPRHYALDCLRMDSIEKRQHYLTNTVSPEYRDWVKHYLREWWPRRAELLRNKN